MLASIKVSNLSHGFESRLMTNPITLNRISPENSSPLTRLIKPINVIYPLRTPIGKRNAKALDTVTLLVRLVSAPTKMIAPVD